MSFLTQRQAEPLEKTTAGRGTHKSRLSLGRRSLRRCRLSPPPAGPGPSPPPPIGHSDPRSLPACPRRSEIEPGRRLRPGEAQSGQSSPALLFPAPRGGGSALTTRAGLPAAPTGPLSSGTPGLPPRPAAAPPVVPAGPGAAPPSPAATPLPLRQRPSCASTAPLTAHLPRSLPLSLALRTTRPFLRPPSPTAGTGRNSRVPAWSPGGQDGGTMARLGEGTSRSVRDGLQCQMPSSFQATWNAKICVNIPSDCSCCGKRRNDKAAGERSSIYRRKKGNLLKEGNQEVE
ncbi:nascent polypeptide-associated complex subunit alpha, muscle-specific form-like [Prinia subflava]|uniref:nascent polypeptide-associated complex subunit alpha, muscle-specific form-like n=1 Tax=Prinia subflava TaxID=208062 RepID=UPI002FDF0AE9